MYQNSCQTNFPKKEKEVKLRRIKGIVYSYIKKEKPIWLLFFNYIQLVKYTNQISYTRLELSTIQLNINNQCLNQLLITANVWYMKSKRFRGMNLSA